MTRTTIWRGLGALAAAAFLIGLALATASADGASGPKSTFTRCEELPHPFNAAHEINYDADARTVTFVWEDGQRATMRDTDKG